MKTKHSNFKTVLIRGIFYFRGDPGSNFKGPIKRGFRPIVWLDSVDKATSCSFVFDGEIFEGEKKDIDMVILNELAFGQKIIEGMLLNVGSTKHKIGQFIVGKHLGTWKHTRVP